MLPVLPSRVAFARLRSRFSLAGCCVLALSAILAWAASVRAQAPAGGVQPGYTVLRIKPPFDNRLELGKRGAKVRQVLAGRLSLRDRQVQADFDAYYNDYFFRAMTDPAASLADKRLELSRQLRTAGKNQDVHDHLIALVLGFMDRDGHPNALVRGPYQLGVRYNAMLAIGELNAAEADIGKKRPPVPLPQAIPILLREYESPDQIDAVRLAALLGILRHANLSGRADSAVQPMPAAAKDKIVQLMLGLIAAKDPPQGRTPDGHAWFQRLALDILAAFEDPGPDGQIAAAVENVMADRDAPLSVRAEAAQTLGKLQYTGKWKVDPSDAARRLGSLAVAACRDELNRIDEQKRREAERAMLAEGGGATFGGAYSGGGGGDYDDEEEEPEEEEEDEEDGGGGGPSMSITQPATVKERINIKFTRRRLKEFLASVREGLTGSSDPKTTAVQDSLGQLGGVYMLAGDETSRSYVENLIAKVNALDQVLDVQQDQFAEAQITLDTLTQELRIKVAELETLTSAGGAGVVLPGTGADTAGPESPAAPAGPPALAPPAATSPVGPGPLP